jgi:hypothetical protein
MSFSEALAANLLSPPILFFALGIIAALVKSDLRFPEQFYSALTIYLLTAIGFKGGVAVHEAGIARVWLPALAGIALSATIPLWCFAFLRRAGRLPVPDAASIAAHFGSVSAVTFITAVNYLKQAGVPSEGYASAFLAVMESPAIIAAVILARASTPEGSQSSLKPALHDAFLGRSVILLIGALLVGWISGPAGLRSAEGFFVTPFFGVIALFLLEMGIVTGRRLGDLRKAGPFLLLFGIAAPILNGCLGAAAGAAAGLSIGGSMLMATLAASASYIAAPAAMRVAIPEARPALSLATALGIAFPFNISVGLPLYLELARRCHSLFHT